MNDKPFISLASLTGYVAMWATRQSTYHAPDGLTDVLRDFWRNALPYSDEALSLPIFPVLEATRDNLTRILKDSLLSIPQVRLWNERKNGNQAPFAFVSRYDHPSPDNDFIDLDALIGNIVRSCIEEDHAAPSNTGSPTPLDPLNHPLPKPDSL